MTSRVQKLANEVLDALGSCGLSLATAESCTGGGIGQALTAVPGSSQIYRGGVISYTNGVKTGLLGVPEQLLRELVQSLLRWPRQWPGERGGLSGGCGCIGYGPGGTGRR